MRDIYRAIDRTKGEFALTLDRMLEIVSEPDKINPELEEELEVQTALAIDKYNEFGILDKQVLNNFVNYCILPIFLYPSGTSRACDKKPFERNFMIEYSINKCKPKNKHKTEINNIDGSKISIPLDNGVMKDFNSIPDFQYTLEKIIAAEDIKKPKEVIFEDDGILFHYNKRRWKKIKINRSYVEIKPNYTNQFINSDIHDNFEKYIQSLTYRIKSPISLVHKYYDYVFELDKIHPKYFEDYTLEDTKNFTKENWNNIVEKAKSDKNSNSKNFDSLPDYMEEDIDKTNKLKSMIDIIADINAMRIITPERFYASQITGFLGSKIFNQEIEQYYVKNKNFNRDRVDNVIDGFLQYRPYCEERGTKKTNKYETYQSNLRYSGSLIELQVRSFPMHIFNEYGGADHKKYTESKKMRRACHLSIDSKHKATYDLFKRIFYHAEINL